MSVTEQDRRYERDADYQFTDLIAAEEWHFWFRSRRALAIWALDRYFPDTKRLLEVGCGAGFVLAGLRRWRSNLTMVACDLSLEALQHARRRAIGARVLQGDARHLPVRGGFDAVIALDVIEHIYEDVDALREMFGVLRPGGGLLLMVPQHPWLWSRVDEFSHHCRRYRRGELIAKLREAGFDVVRWTSYFSATLPLAVMSRRQRADEAFDPTAELRMPRAVNRLLDLMMRPESWLVRAGMSLPLGSSLLVAARRPPS